jgi:hypothetical protein
MPIRRTGGAAGRKSIRGSTPLQRPDELLESAPLALKGYGLSPVVATVMRFQPDAFMLAFAR